MPNSEPDSATVDAWLAGDLPADVAAEVERYFGQSGTSPAADAEDDTIPPELLQDLPDTATPDDVAQLVNLVKTQHAPDMPAPSKEAWREALTPCDDPALLGTIGDYEVIEVIATGGMGIVFKARDPELDRLAAIKVLSPELATNATARARFLREARAAAKLEHENILPIYGVHDDAVPYFAMRYAAGGTLHDKLDGELPFKTQSAIARQVSAALGAAHTKGIVHRDIKPANILFDAPGGTRVWVCDFGIARSTEDPSLTYAGAVAGTPQYMSPEQAAGSDLDGRSDLFSLGAVLYRCASGEHAFSGNTTAAVLQSLSKTDATTINRSTVKLPKWYERLLTNLLAKDPRDRPRDAAAVVRAIDDEYSPRPKHTARRNKRLAIAAVTVASLTALIAGILQVPAVKNGVNGLLAQRYEQAFFIDGKLGAHRTLAEAIEDAANRDTILLPGGQAIPVDNLQLPSNKALTLKPADIENRPTLTTAITGAPGIIATAPLRLEAIDFVLNSKHDSDGIIIAKSTDLTLDDCRFTSTYKSSGRTYDIKPRTVELHGATSASLEGCRLDLPGCNSITLFTSPESPGSDHARIALRSCEITAYYGIALHDVRSASTRIEIEAAGITYSGQHFIKRSMPGDLPSITCEVIDSKFDVQQTLCWLPVSNERELIDRFRWNGRNNDHIPGRAWVRISGKKSDMDLKHFRNIVEFSAPAALISQLMRKDGGEIVIEATGQKFYQLADAIKNAPPDATLLVSGQLAPVGQVLTAQDRRIHIHAAPGASPTIIARGHGDHALFLRGGGSIKGIRFLRENARDGSMPVLGVRPGAAEIIIEDCVFESVFKGETTTEPDAAFIITDAENAIVRRCEFRHPQGLGLGINFINAESPPTKVKIEECIFAGKSAIATFTRNTSTRLQLIGERCVFVCDQLFTLDQRTRFGRTELALTDCIIDTSRSLFSLPDTPRASLSRHLAWSGTRNHYRDGTPVLTTPLTALGVPQPSPVRSFTDLAMLIPNCSEQSPTFTTPFDRKKLGNKATPAALLKALSEEIESPAAAVLADF